MPSIALAPNQKTIITVPYNKNMDAGSEYLLNIYFTLKNDTNWEKAGYEMASAQFALNGRQPISLVDTSSMSDVQVSTQGDNLVIGGRNFNTAFNSQTGIMTFSMAERK